MLFDAIDLYPPSIASPKFKPEPAAVGRNRPPFSRTNLYYGTLPFALPPEMARGGAGDKGGAQGCWVVKQWLHKASAGRKNIGTTSPHAPNSLSLPC
jgi:hypothetical protein